MDNSKMTKIRYGRHAPEFILLLLAEEPGYGMDLYKKLKQFVPISKFDSAIVYRTLAKLKKEGSVEFEWDMSETGPAKKIYRITPTGLEKLKEHKDYVDLRIRNLQIFLDKFERLKSAGKLK
jgi:DNA-binding PadR family transcriptional regulator